MALSIKGQVYKDGIYLSGAVVRLYDRDTKLLVSQTVSSSPYGYYTFTPSYSGPFFIVALVNSTELYNALIWDNIVPIDI